ncbi:MAG: NAD-dependent DNA ligase LigA [Bacilli bacterium]|jgi:DNA ligase (NAD+)
MDALSRIKELTSLINQYNKEYYELDSPTISDVEYDSLLRELERLENEYPEFIQNNSPVKRVGSLDSTKLNKIIHTEAMLSLANAFNEEELRAFSDRIIKDGYNPTFVCELKIDGIASTVKYEQGALVLGATRGDGTVGENITENMKTIKSLPLKLKDKLDIEVRGEVYMRLDVFNDLNQKKEKESESLFKNPRNAAGGSLRQLNSEITKERNLDIFNYTIVNPSKYNLKTQIEVLEFLLKQGFKVETHFKCCKNIDEVLEYIEHLDKLRKTLNYDTDGVVIKVNELELYEQIGYTVKTPKWAIAYKFPALEVETRLKGIEFTVGRTGTINPTALLDPVMISGSLVQRATLNNEDYIKEKDIRINDYVLVRKAGEIIPEIVRVNFKRRPEDTIAFEMINACPVCNSKVVRKEGQADYYCTNDLCEGKLLASIIYFASKPAMNIEGLGEKVVTLLYNEGFIKSFKDIYFLKDKKDVLVKLESKGEKSVTNLLNAIEESKKSSLDKVITALGIRFVGSKIAKTLAKTFKSLEALEQAKLEDLLEIPEIGDAIASSVVEYFEKEKRIIKDLIEVGINPTFEEVGSEKVNFLNLNVVLTGRLEKYTRDEAKAIIEAQGGNILSSVTKNTDLVIAGSDAGSKLEKAVKLNIKIINEDDFIKLV